MSYGSHVTDEYVPDQRVALDLLRIEHPFAAEHRAACESTQAEVKRCLDQGSPAPVVVTADAQLHGRGRLDRTWQAPACTSVLMSMGLPLPSTDIPFTSLVGVVVARALREHGVDVMLKWPNDLVVQSSGRWRKLGGILVEVHGGFAVVGIGVNIDMLDSELPTADAISCRQLGLRVSRESLISRIAVSLNSLPAGATIEEYRALCATIGVEVNVSPIIGPTIRGTAIRVSDDGALEVRVDDEVVRVTVGDVQHVRPVQS
mgnify:CR=1 FL=1